MRPVRLELQGFTAFRDPTEVAFGEATLFAFTGPTGSGKSSLIDAMVFALYGSVPRYDDRRTVEPVVSLGREEARVRFDFAVGERAFSAVRVVRRTRSGATTAEARLEGGAEPVSGAKEVTDAVEGLLGLGFEHFTKCVVLPQGEFAEFLHDTGTNRRALLKRLLDLDVYAVVRSAAAARAKEAGDRARFLEERRAELVAGAGGDAERTLLERRAALERLRDRVAADEPALVEAGAEVDRLRREVEAARERAAALAAIRVPERLEDTIAAVRHGSAALEEARTRLARAETELADARDRRERLPARETLAGRLERHAARADLAERAGRGAAVTAEAEARVAAAEQARAGAAEALAGARAVLAGAERAHLAHVLAEELGPGDPCPVCGRPVDSVPGGPLPEAVDGARRAVEEAERALAASDVERTEAALHLERCRSTAEAVAEQLTRVEAELGEETADDVAGRLDDVDAAQRALEASVAVRDAAAGSAAELERALEASRSALSASWASYDAARDRVAAAGPPAPDRDDLGRSWETLASWAAEAAAAAAGEASALGERLDSVAESLARRRAELLEALRAAGVEPGDRTPIEAVATALAGAGHELERIRRDREEAEGLSARMAEARERETVAKELAYHLQGNRFEAWLLEEAFGALVDGANRRLDDLTGGAYSLALDDQTFAVVDHRNADQRRGVKTLSGGETFLVSLALALALSEQLSELAVEGAARLESIFLDEGFGTLDADTLDLVAAVLDELGATGRTVGIVTHVTELAERLPVRFELQKVGPGATVRRVEA